MREKIIRSAIAAVLAVSIIFASACSQTETIIPPGMEPIYIEVYQGGYGAGWAREIADRFNKSTANEAGFHLAVRELKKEGLQILQDISVGNNSDLYFSASSIIQMGIYQNLLEDLSDVADSVAPGDTVPIKNKLIDKDDWYSIFRNNVTGQGLYGLPYLEGITGLIYDHTLFIDKEFYSFAQNNTAEKTELTAQGITFTEDGEFLKFVSATSETGYNTGDKILTAGKDGKYGTYDDGQPMTEAEFAAMVSKIKNTNGANGKPIDPFIWSGRVDDYLDMLFAGLFAQIGGKDEFFAYFTYDSGGKQVRLQDGNEIITPENGYKVFGLQSLVDTYDFFRKYIANTTYMHEAAKTDQNTHLQVQKLFLTGFLGSNNNNESAMLIDGAWWEHESNLQKNFDQLVNDYNAYDREYGMREYRYLLFPDMGEKQATDKSAFATGASGVTIMPRTIRLTGANSNVTASQKKEMIKDFLRFMYSDRTLSYITGETGNVFPMNFEMLPEDYERLTPFSKNMISIYFDHDNIEVMRPKRTVNASPLNYTSGRGVTCFPIKVGSVLTSHVYTVASSNSAYSISQIASMLKNTFTSTDWASYMAKCREEGFFGG